MSEETTYETQRIDHLGIVTGISREIELVETIDKKVGQTGRKVSCGEGALAMIQNALGFSSRALYLMPDYLKNKPVDLLIRPGLVPEDFNDDSMGRCLDDLYACGVTEVFASVASKALRVYEIEHQFVHLDSSSFHLHGQYDVETPDEEMISITHGYSRDHRPDLKQVVAQIITSNKSSLPVWLEVLSGNSSDKESFSDSVKAYCKHLAGDKQPYFVMDSAGYSENGLKEMKGMLWLTRVPETLSEAKRLVRETMQGNMAGLTEGYWGKEEKSNYGEVEQRWLVVFSQAAYDRELKTLERAQGKEQEKAEKQWRKVCQGMFNCQEDAKAACKQFNKRWKYHRATEEISPITQYAHPGRPVAGSQPDVVGYTLTGTVGLYNEGVEEAKRGLGKFIIATNELDTHNLSAAAMLENYTAQGVSVERGFRFLKDPMFFANSLFLKSPARIMALIMIMGLALLIFALGERKLRQSLKQNNETIPDQKGKPTQTPTLRWVFQIFEGLDILSVWTNGSLVTREVMNLRPVHQQIIRLLGPQIQRCYLIEM
ncbi:IS1634 family transposase [Chloroflexota bacterium]